MIECKDLSMKYGKKVIFENYNHVFEDGSITAILGHSGRGKTTLIRCIAGLNKPYNGQVIYTHDELNEVITKPCKDIFMMHQHYSNFPWKTCLENLLLPLEINNKKITKNDKEKATLLLEKVGLKEYANLYPSSLSGGMNQRLALARTIMIEPKVLLMDEPMSALDSETRALMQDLLLDMHKRINNTIILITHDTNEAKKLADIIINF